jgi:hypothetical protein
MVDQTANWTVDQTVHRWVQHHSNVNVCTTKNPYPDNCKTPYSPLPRQTPQLIESPQTQVAHSLTHLRKIYKKTSHLYILLLANNTPERSHRSP